jgi:hypothetical protein
MTETPEEFRQRAERIANKFFEDFEKRGGPLRERVFDYEKLAVDYSHKGFQTLTYLNGGALVALPAALSFFKADVPRVQIVVTAACFAIGLVLVVYAQAAAFFTMAKRAEAYEHYKHEQFNRVAALTFPHEHDDHVNRQGHADKERDIGNFKTYRSNIYRIVGLICFGGSLMSFIAGCTFGVLAVLHAKG